MSQSPTPLEQPCVPFTAQRSVSIGLPAASVAGERRFPLTPEGAAMLVGRGIDVKIECGAADVIHFDDEAYRRAGAQIVSRPEAMACDMVLHLPAISAADARMLRRGSVLLTLLHIERQSPEALRVLLERNTIAVALDLIADESGHRPFADALSEVDGRAAIAIASSLLADPVHGKGILLGGVSGVVPCEVTIIGSGIAARSAALSACGLGATVKMFDNDVYGLRDAGMQLSRHAVITSAFHPRVFASALRSADIVVATTTKYPLEIDVDMVDEMKRGVIAFDLTGREDRCVFPSLARVDLAVAADADRRPNSRVAACYVNAGSAVPRTAAMTLTTTLMTLLDDIHLFEGFANALKFNQGLSRAAYTFLGKPVNADVARILGVRPIDINLFVQFN